MGKPSGCLRYTWEFLSIFIAVVSAFALNNWNENRREGRAHDKIILEVKNGLEKDISDLELNMRGHRAGISACDYFHKLILNEEVSMDSLFPKYIMLTRDFTSLQNRSGYETLKSKGLELMTNDSLRADLISLYEYDYYTLRKMEEEYEESQFHKTYFEKINELLAPNMVFSEDGKLASLNTPLNLNSTQRKVLLSYLLKIKWNREFIMRYYSGILEKVNELKDRIEEDL